MTVVWSMSTHPKISDGVYTTAVPHITNLPGFTTGAVMAVVGSVLVATD